MASARTNTRLPDSAVKALPYWPRIEYAAANNLTTAALWSLIRDDAAELGLEAPGVGIVGVSQLRGIAAGIQRNSAALNAAADERRLLTSMVSRPPWAGDTPRDAASRGYTVRFQHTTVVDGAESTEWRSVRFSGALPRTVGDLRDLVNRDAIQLARKYKSAHVSADALQLLID